jgi:alkylhydroperoxidase family enzyme
VTTLFDADIRSDLIEAHRSTVEAASRPGDWWTGPERNAIAAEVRRALAHADWAPWQAPSGVEGTIAEGHPLPASAVDAIWRITNHPGTLTHDWYEQIVDGLPSVLHYVELVGLVATVNAVERFASIMGFDPHQPVESAPGDPVAVVPDGVGQYGHWVPTTGNEGPRVLQALSAVPRQFALWRAHSEAQYVPAEALTADLTWTRGALSRVQVELLAARTSQANECFY